MSTTAPLPVPPVAGAYAVGETGYTVVQPPQSVANPLRQEPLPVSDDLVIPSPNFTEQ